MKIYNNINDIERKFTALNVFNMLYFISNYVVFQKPSITMMVILHTRFMTASFNATFQEAVTVQYLLHCSWNTQTEPAASFPDQVASVLL